MKLFVDSIAFYLQRSGGISLYWSELLRRFLSDRGINVKTNYSVEDSGNFFGGCLNVGYGSPDILNLTRYLDFSLSDKFDVVHSSYYRVPFIKDDSLVVTTVHDYTYEYYRNGLPKHIHSWQKARAIRASDGIIAISNSTKLDILKFNPFLDPKKIAVIYNGVSPDYYPIRKKGDFSENYVLFVGGRSGYKNFMNVVPAVASISGLKLYVVGASLTEPEITFLEKFLPLRYKCFTDVDNSLLNVLYNSAVALVYPSLYEGFGIPVAEAMAAGCPVVAANVSSIPEVAGDSGILLDHPTSENIANAIQMITDGTRRNDLIRSGIIQSKKFSWDKCYQETKIFYERVLSSELS